MSVKIIDTLKPKNNGAFPIVEAVDVAVSDDLRLPEALEAKADASALAETNTAVAEKANASDVATATANLQGQINQIEISATAEAVVAPEVAAARVNDDGTEYSTLKERLDADSTKATAEISGIGRIVDGIIDFDFVAETLTMTNNKVIDATTGEITTVEDQYSYVSNYVDLTGYSMCKITAQAHRSNYIFAFYDSSYNFVSGIASAAGENRTTLTNKIVNIPANAKYIALSQRYSDIHATLNNGTASPKGIEAVEESVSAINDVIVDISEPAYDIESRDTMTRYASNGYIDSSNGTFVPNDNYQVYYNTIKSDGELWIDNQTHFAQVVIFSSTFLDSDILQTTSTTLGNLPTEDNKMTVSAGQTVMVSSKDPFVLNSPNGFKVKYVPQSLPDDVAELQTDVDSLTTIVDDISELAYDEESRGTMNRYETNGYIDSNSGIFIPFEQYQVYYDTIKSSGDLWIDNQTAFAQVAIYNGSFPDGELVQIGSTAQDNLPTVDNKMTVLAGQTVVVSSKNDFVLHSPNGYQAKYTPVPIQIKLKKVDDTHIDVYVPSVDGKKTIRYVFERYQKTWNTLSYTDGNGDAQTAADVVSSDYWNNIEVYDASDGSHIAQGNSNFITKVTGADAHAGDGHGNEVMLYYEFLCDGIIVDVESMQDGDQVLCSSLRIISNSKVFKVGSGSGNEVSTAFPDLDTSGNPIVNFLHKMEMSFEIGNRVTINNKLIVKQNGITFNQCHGAMLECYFVDFTNVMCNNGESTRNTITSEGAVTVPSDSTINFRTETSQKANYVEMYGGKFFIRQKMQQDDSTRDSKSRIVFEFYNNRLKCYLQPVVASYGKQSGETIEEFNAGDVISVTNTRIIE